MVINITMKNVVPRNGIYHFRISIPKDCRSVLNQTEYTESLKTSDEAEATVRNCRDKPAARHRCGSPVNDSARAVFPDSPAPPSGTMLR